MVGCVKGISKRLIPSVGEGIENAVDAIDLLGRTKKAPDERRRGAARRGAAKNFARSN